MDQEFAAIDALPDEILLMIFNNISGHELNVSVSKVSQRWKHIISHILLKIMYPGDDEKIHGGLTSLLVTSYIPSLPGPSAIIFQIATLIPNLKELTISLDYSLNDTELKIVETLHNLRHLDVFAISKSLNEKTPIPYNITSLVVNNNMAPGFLCKIEKQRVMEAFHMYGRSVHYPPKEMVRFLESHCSCLTQLTLRCSELTDSRYKTISQCQGLTSLQLYSCVQLTSKGVSHLTNLMNLRRLHLTGMRMVRVNSLLDFIQRLPRQIEELNFSYSWFGDEHCSALAARLPNLRCLELWRTRVSAFRLVQLIKLLTSLEDLDTDAIFVDGHIKAFSGHRSLKNIRCRWIGQIKTRFHIKSAIETVPAQYLREDEEGPRGGLFYYWLQDLSIRTAPHSPVAPAGLGPYIVRKSSDYDLYDRPLYDGFLKI